MKLKILSEYNHTDIVSSCCWTSDNTLYSMSDDKTILTWNNNGDFLSKFLDLENYCTACEWSNISKMGGELLAIGGADGSLTLVSKSGKIEKRVENNQEELYKSLLNNEKIKNNILESFLKEQGFDIGTILKEKGYDGIIHKEIILNHKSSKNLQSENYSQNTKCATSVGNKDNFEQNGDYIKCYVSGYMMLKIKK